MSIENFKKLLLKDEITEEPLLPYLQHEKKFNEESENGSKTSKA